MSQATIDAFARQINISIEKLLDQLEQAGVSGKTRDDLLEDHEKLQLLQHLESRETKAPSKDRVFVKSRQTRQIRQTSRTGAARTVHVEVKKRRTFVKRSTLEADQARQEEEERVAREAREAEEQAEKEKELSIAAREASPEESQQPPQEEPRPGEAQPEELPKEEPPESVEAVVQEPVVEREDDSTPPPAAERETTPQAATTPAPKPVAADADAKTVDRKKPGKAKRGKKGKRERDGNTGTQSVREELHAAKRRRDKSRRLIRKPGRISSSTSNQHVFEKPTAPVVHEIQVSETMTVGELAQAMSIKAGEVIKAMMDMGSMVTINQILDQDTAMLLIEEMGHVARPADKEDPESMLSDQDEVIEQVPRPPVVTVMGHVDHGKTSLLDYLRNTKVVDAEAGGITQHIGAYRVTLNDHEICFLDTPGHEAFSAMRARGAKATDIIILVVAADDGVKPQTVEAINHAKAAEVPIVVALNKIDREQADPERVKQELSNRGVVPEEWGGDTLVNEVSAITGQGVEELLESVLLQAEVADLTARPAGNATGLVVEARLDKGRGPVATALVQQGLLKQGDIVLAGRETGRVREILDDRGRRISEAGPSTPVEIQGLAGTPVAGDEIVVVGDERRAREIATNRQGRSKELKLAQQQKVKFESIFNRMKDGDVKTLNVLVKADVQGSVEAIRGLLIKLSVDAVNVNVVHGMVGGINESDVNLAMATGALIIGFNVRADATARKLIEKEGITVLYYNVIYDVIDAVKATMTGLLSPISKEHHVGLVEVRDIFRAPKIGAIAGSYVTEGIVRKNLPVRVLRENTVIFEGAIDSLKRFKDDVNEVKNGYECGIGIRDYNDIRVGDQIEVFEIVQTAQEL